MPRKPASHRQPRQPRREGRPSASARGYDVNWRRFRLVVLAWRPVCEACGRQPSRHVDHIVALEKGGARYDEDNLQALCHSCHSKKTVRCDRGFGRAPQ